MHCPNCGHRCWRLEADELGREWVCPAGCAIRFKRMRTGKAWSELMEFLVRNLIGEADVTRATIFEDQYISTGGQFYELIVGHDRFNADLRPTFYRMQNQPEGLCCHPYDCATLLIAEEAGVVITDEKGAPLDGPLDTTTGLSWVGYANRELRQRIEPLLLEFLHKRGSH